MKNIALVVAGLVLAGCTSTATRQAIDNYRLTEEHKQLAFDNTLRIAKEQSYQALSQYIQLHKDDPAAVQVAVRAGWQFRDAIEDCRTQYLLSRAMTTATVGAYLYDQQGPLQVWFGEKAKQVDDFSSAWKKANDKTGATPSDLIGQFDPNAGAKLQELLRRVPAVAKPH